MAGIQFPTIEQLESVLLAELPNGLYPVSPVNLNDPTNNAVSSSEMYAASKILSDVYSQLSIVYQNKFLPTVTTDGVSQWNQELFSTPQDASQPLNEQINNLIAKYQYLGGISFQLIRSLISALLTPLNLTFDLCPYGGQGGISNGGWLLGKSHLGIGTTLAFYSPVKERVNQTVVDCSQNYQAAGLTSGEFLDIQRTAYLYEVRIFGNATDTTLAYLDQFLTAIEPARSSHVDPLTDRNLILNNVTPYANRTSPVPYNDALFQTPIDFQNY